MGIKLLENNFKLPCYAGTPPSPLLQHILLLCEYTDPLGESFPPRLTWTLNYWKTTLRSHVYKGFPFINLSTTPIFAYLTYLVARCKTFRPPRLKWALNYWKTTLNSHVMQAPPPLPSYNTYYYCVNTRTHLVSHSRLD